MFATTEPHKIPITILSRCQRFDLRRIRLSSMVQHLAFICRQEGVDISAESLEVIAREAGGSARDSLSLLDQVLSGGQRSVSHAQVLETLGVIDRNQLYELAGAILTGDPLRFLAILDDIYDCGHDLKKLFSDLLGYLRDLWVIQTSGSPEKLVDLPGHMIEQMRGQAEQTPRGALEQTLELLFREEAAVRLSPHPKLAIEMAFFRRMQMRGALSIDTLIAKLDDLRREVQGAGPAPSPSGPRSAPPPPAGSARRDAGRGPDVPDLSGTRAASGEARSAGTRGDRASSGEASWQQVINAVAGRQPSLASTLKRCVLKQGGAERVEIQAPGNSFVAQKLKQEKNVAILQKACAEIYGGSPEVVVVAAAENGGSTAERRDRHHVRVNQTLSHPVIMDALDIFNGKVVDVKVSKEVDK
jgi:DNA polymerase-3 subunit gamma/tau